MNPPGKVFLVGAGPGDPDLLTVKAARLIQAADAIVYDHLVGKEILNHVRPETRMIYVGKKASKHVVPQETINAMLVSLAQEGLQVVRLKGGDPFIFGRGGEELATLAKAGITYEVVPGVTAAAGCAAYAGFPLTHRDFSQSVTLVTGHLKDHTVNLDWPALARPQQTVVFYMGVAAAQEISLKMQAHGLSGITPAAIIRNGTLPDQTTLVATLATLAECITLHQVRPPALIIVGDVVSLQPELAWR